MKKIFTLFVFAFLTISQVQAQGDGPSGSFVGPVIQVICGESQVANAFYYIAITAENYNDARNVALTTIDRFTNFYDAHPEFLSDFYNCRPLGCKAPSSCESEAYVLGITPVRLTPLSGNLYLLLMDINYKVACFSCGE